MLPFGRFVFFGPGIQGGTGVPERIPERPQERLQPPVRGCYNLFCAEAKDVVTHSFSSCGSHIRSANAADARQTDVVGVWRSLVARTLGVGEVAGSNPVTPTIHMYRKLLSWIVRESSF